MLKNKLFYFVVFAAAAIFAVTLVGCANDSTDAPDPSWLGVPGDVLEWELIGGATAYEYIQKAGVSGVFTGTGYYKYVGKVAITYDTDDLIPAAGVYILTKMVEDGALATTMTKTVVIADGTTTKLITKGDGYIGYNYELIEGAKASFADISGETSKVYEVTKYTSSGSYGVTTSYSLGSALGTACAAASNTGFVIDGGTDVTFNAAAASKSGTDIYEVIVYDKNTASAVTKVTGYAVGTAVASTFAQDSDKGYIVSASGVALTGGNINIALENKAGDGAIYEVTTYTVGATGDKDTAYALGSALATAFPQAATKGYVLKATAVGTGVDGVAGGIAAPTTGASDYDLYELGSFVTGSGSGGLEYAGGATGALVYSHVLNKKLIGATTTTKCYVLGEKIASRGEYIKK